jgi:CRP-like cAMP-binding protein
MQPQSQQLSAFYDFIAQRILLTREEWLRTAGCLEILHCKADMLLLKEGQVCRHLYFTNQGLLRFFMVSADGKDTTKFFTPEYQLFTSQQSFSTQTPSRECIQAITDAELLSLPHAALQLLYQDIPKWQAFIRRILQEVNGMTERIYMDSITTTAEDRYRKLLSEEPNIALRAPLKHIASYLGVTPESLSRIRKKISEEK